MIDLPDVNLWVALTAKDHPHYDRAQKYWHSEAAPRIAFCPPTMMGLLRGLTSQHVVKTNPLTVQDAWQVYRDWRNDPAVTYVNEPARCPILLDQYVVQGAISPRIWSDAYLAALAEAGSMRLVSFDSDFKRFASLNFLHLIPEHQSIPPTTGMLSRRQGSFVWFIPLF